MKRLSIRVGSESNPAQLVNLLDQKLSGLSLKSDDQLVLKNVKQCIHNYAESVQKLREHGTSTKISKKFETSTFKILVELKSGDYSIISQLFHKLTGNL